MDLQCKHCQKDCTSANSHRNHERTCPLNVNRVYKNGMTGKTGSNQFTRARDLGHAAPVVSIETRSKIAAKLKLRPASHFKSNGVLISATINAKVERGEWHTSLARRMHYQYKGVDLHGKWELAYAKFLDSCGTNWVRNTEQFPYIMHGKLRKYTPDFYLPGTDEYIEIKGYETEKDSLKWKQFPKTLVVLKEKELKALGII